MISVSTPEVLRMNMSMVGVAVADGYAGKGIIHAVSSRRAGMRPGTEVFQAGFQGRNRSGAGGSTAELVPERVQQNSR